MKNAVIVGVVLVWCVLFIGCACDCDVCCPSGQTETCSTALNVDRQDCEDQNGVAGCTAECR